MINIFIADDHQMVREGIRRIVEDKDNMQVCGEAEDGEKLVELLKTASVDVLLLDISMPGPGFLETLRRVIRTYPEIKILVLSAHAEEQYAKRSFKAGAKGYLTKNHSPEELVVAIERINNGGKYISQTLAEKLAFEIDKPDLEQPHESLSQREYQILCLLGSGKTVSIIAEDLSLSPKTVSTYRSRILEKMNLKDNSEIMRYVMDNQLEE